MSKLYLGEPHVNKEGFLEVPAQLDKVIEVIQCYDPTYINLRIKGGPDDKLLTVTIERSSIGYIADYLERPRLLWQGSYYTTKEQIFDLLMQVDDSKLSVFREKVAVFLAECDALENKA